MNFQHIPANIRVPLFYAELDNSKANTAVPSQRTLIMGQMTSSGDATANVAVLSQGVADAKSRFGLGSQLALMVDWYRKRDTFGEVWCCPLADDGSGVAATGILSFTGPTTAAGVLSLYIAAQRVAVTIASGTAATAVATAVIAAINAATDLPVTALVDGTDAFKVNLTAKNKGLVGNDIDVRLNYLGLAGGEATPAGLACTITAMASGATNPTLTTALTNLGDMPFDAIVIPWNDATSLNALKSFLDDTTGRWSYANQIYGHVFAALRGTVSARTTLGLARNNQHETISGLYDTPLPAFLMAANTAGAAVASLRSDPALPLQTLATDIPAPPVASRDTLGQRNTCLYDGISTYSVGDDGTVSIEGMITTYQKNGFSQADDSYLYVETMFTLMAVLRRLRGVVTSKYGRKKLADNGTRVLAGSNAVTPNTIRADIIAQYREMEGDLVENGDAFAEQLIVERNTVNRSRVDVLWPGDLIGGLRIFALLAQFRA